MRPSGALKRRFSVAQPSVKPSITSVLPAPGAFVATTCPPHFAPASPRSVKLRPAPRKIASS